MNQEHYQNANTQPYDVKYISRCLMRNALFILMFACLAGVFSYIFLDHYKKDTYTASVNLYVIQRDNAGIKFNSTGISSAVSRCVSALNSDMMKEQIKKEKNADKLKGKTFGICSRKHQHHCHECDEQFGGECMPPVESRY